ncbi:glycosyltransferase [candidate division KSB1 bacterium]|nr:glycosyltransferase [candidate division KSB1 bacterium]
MNNTKTICIAGIHSLLERTGGAEWQTHYIGEALVKYGFNVIHLCPSLEGKTGYSYINKQKSIYWYPHVASFWNVPVETCLAFLYETRPDLIYIRGRTALQESGVVEKYKRSTKTPYLFGLSSDGELQPHYRLTALWGSKKKRLKKITVSAYAMWSDLRMRQTLKKADMVICQHRSQLQKAHTINKNNFCLPSLHSKRRVKSEKSNQNLIVWIANNRPEKQSKLFIELAKQLQSVDCKFIMVLGNSRWSQTLPKPTSNLEILHSQPKEKIDEILARATLLVNTSKIDVEGFPNVFIQAWLTETVVVSLHANPENLLSREQIGVHSHTFAQLVCDVKNLLENRTLRIQMGQRARQYAEQHHSFENNWKKVARRFQTALQQDAK